MRVKTSDLTGAALDRAVARAAGVPMPNKRSLYTFEPSTRWEDAGPIIERESISLDAPGGWMGGREPGHWRARQGARDMKAYLFMSVGPTPLIAAMRCYVTAALGDEIEIPDSLT